MMTDRDKELLFHMWLTNPTYFMSGKTYISMLRSRLEQIEDYATQLAAEAFSHNLDTNKFKKSTDMIINSEKNSAYYRLIPPTPDEQKEFDEANNSVFNQFRFLLKRSKNYKDLAESYIDDIREISQGKKTLFS